MDLGQVQRNSRMTMLMDPLPGQRKASTSSRPWFQLPDPAAPISGGEPPIVFVLVSLTPYISFLIVEGIKYP